MLKAAKLLLEAQELLGSTQGRETVIALDVGLLGASRPPLIPSDTSSSLATSIPTLSQFFESYRQFQLV